MPCGRDEVKFEKAEMHLEERVAEPEDDRLGRFEVCHIWMFRAR